MAYVNMEEEESFDFQVERVGNEIRSRFARAHQILQDRERELLTELEALVSEFSGKGLREQIAELEKLKHNLISAVEQNENKETVENSAVLMEARIRNLEAKLATSKTRLKRVSFEWDGEVEGKLSVIGTIRLRGKYDYKEKGNPVIVACRGIIQTTPGPDGFYIAPTIAIDAQTKNVFVCDALTNCVKVFTKSFEFIRQFGRHMLTPCGICIYKERVYITQWRKGSLNVYSMEGKMLQSVGSKGEGYLEFDRPMGIAISTNDIIYICDNFNFRIQCLSLDLKFHSIIPEIFRPRDIKVTQKEIIVLKRGNTCVCIFNYSHQLVREFIRCGPGSHLVRPIFFCLDDEQNLLITDFFAHCVFIFSFGGELIHKFGKKGDGRGDFLFPEGIALDSDNRIIVASLNYNYPIQLF